MKSIEKLDFKILFWVYIIVLTVIGLFTFSNYGITGDGDLHRLYGDYVWGYLKSGGEYKGLFTQEKYADSPLKYYGGFFDGIGAVFIDILKPKNEFVIRHLWNMIFGLLSILFAGLIAKELTRSWFAGLLGALFLTLTPRFYGEMFSNPKDIPFATGYVISIYFIIRFLNNIEKPKWSVTIGLASGIAIAIGVRIGGLLVIAYLGLFYALYVLINKKINFAYLKPSLIHATIAVLSGYLVACFWWPFALEDIINNPFIALSTMSSYPLSIYMLYDGMRINTENLTSGYLLRWLWIGTPIIILFGTGGYVLFLLKKIKSVDFLAYALILFSFVFPIFYIIYKKSIVYDTLRHIIFILPMMAIMTSVVIYSIIRYYHIHNKKLFYVSSILTLILVLLPLKHMIVNHPVEYVYFNEIFGGTKKAFGFYETDYNHISGKKAADWLKENVLKNTTTKVSILSNMSTGYLYFQDMDTSKVFASYGRWRERDHVDWDYYIAYSRFIEPENLQNGAWPPGRIVHTVKVDDVPVCVVMKRLNKDDISAFRALNNGDMITAANLYQKNLTVDNSNEFSWYYYSIALANTGRLQEAVQALKYALQINSSNPEWIQELQKYYQMYPATAVQTQK